MLINLLKISHDYCFLDYSLKNEDIESLGVNNWINKLLNSFYNKKLKKFFGQNISINDIDIYSYEEDGYMIEAEKIIHTYYSA